MRRLFAFIAALTLLLIPTTAFADGIIIDPPCLPEGPRPPPPPWEPLRRPGPPPPFPLAL